MPVVLERTQDVQHNQVTDVNVWRGGVEPELDPQVVASLEAPTQVIGDVDLDCALAQVFE